MSDYVIRKLEERDRTAVTSIFNYFVENSFAAYPETKVGDGFMDTIRGMARGGVLFVIEIQGTEVIGFGFLRPHQLTEAFKRACELTYFILPEYSRQGLGIRLLKTIEDDAHALGVETLLANISSLNEQSLNFHRKNGFIEVGRFKRIGKKFDKDFDVVWMQKFL